MTRIIRGRKNTSKLWIFCEGKTEVLYFKNLRAIERIRAHIAPIEVKGCSADQIMDRAIKFSRKEFSIGSDFFDSERDRIVCVFDRDDNSQQVLERVRASCRGSCKEVVVGFSNPCFEFWILSHFGFYDSPAQVPSGVYEMVKNKMSIDTKKETELYEKTMGRIDVAKKNSLKLQKIHEGSGIEIISRDSTPVSLVYQIIDLIDDYR